MCALPAPGPGRAHPRPASVSRRRAAAARKPAAPAAPNDGTDGCSRPPWLPPQHACVRSRASVGIDVAVNYTHSGEFSVTRVTKSRASAPEPLSQPHQAPEVDDVGVEVGHG